jgi:hypothetical protein
LESESCYASQLTSEVDGLLGLVLNWWLYSAVVVVRLDSLQYNAACWVGMRKQPSSALHKLPNSRTMLPDE